MRFGALSAIAFLILVVGSTEPAKSADLILVNGNVVTVEPELPRTEAVAIEGNRILAVGMTGDIRDLAGANTREIDLQGRTVIPGLIDNHVHLLRSAGGSSERLEEIVLALASKGVTSIVDVGGFNFAEKMIEPAHSLESRGRLAVRVFTTYWTGARTEDAVDRAIARFETLDPSHSSRMVQTVGVGETLYLGLHDRPGAPFSPSPADIEMAMRMFAAAMSQGLPLHLHSRTEASSNLFLDLYSTWRSPSPPSAPLLTLHHLENAEPETIDRIGRLGVAAALHPRGAGISADADGKPELRPRAALFEEAGVLWGLGSDATSVSAVDILALMAWASGEAAGGEPKWVVSREAALRASTLSNARLINRADSVGSISPGKLADLVVLDRDLLSPEVQITAVQPVMTVVDGQVVFEAEQPR